MKRCPSCNRTYTDLSLNFCLEDGTPLVIDAPPAEANATVRYPPPRNTSEPPPTEIYRPDSAAVREVRSMPPPPPPPPAWNPVPDGRQKKSNAVWWILGGVFLVGIVGIGLVVGLLVLASMGSVNENENNANSNVKVPNANANSSNSNYGNANSNTNSSEASLTDD